MRAHSERIVRRGAGCLAGLGGFVEANPIGSRVDELHLSAVARTWLDAWIEERYPRLWSSACSASRLCTTTSTAVPGVPSS